MKKTPLRRISKKRQLANTTYDLAKAEWRQDRINKDGYLRCEMIGDGDVVRDLGKGERCWKTAMDSPHHRNRRDRFLSYKRFFSAQCFEHHRLIEDNKNWARHTKPKWILYK